MERSLNQNNISSAQPMQKITNEEEAFTKLDIYPRVIDDQIVRLKYLNISYKKLGNSFAFVFNSTNRPMFVIGPHCIYFFLHLIGPLSFVLFIFINTICLLLYARFLWYFLTSLPTIAFFALYIGVQITLALNVVINPGIIHRDESYSQVGSNCSQCHAFIKEGVHAVHCSMCGVCIEDMDHHCVWIGKCVGKDSIKLFYGLIVIVCLLYVHLIGSVVYYYAKIK